MSADVPRETSQTSETRHRVSDVDYDTWLTKAQAADAIRGSTKMVERLAAEGKIQQAHSQRQGRGAYRTVYQPDDVARIASERRPGVTSFVLPAGVDPHLNGNGHRTLTSPVTSLTGLAVQPPPGDDVLRLLFAAALRAVSETSETRAAYVDRTEALVIAGVSYGELRAAVQAGEVKQRGRRYRRKDLEAL